METNELARLRAALEQIRKRNAQYTHGEDCDYDEDTDGYDEDSCSCGIVEIENICAQALSTPPAPAASDCYICAGQGCIQEIGKTCPECHGSGKTASPAQAASEAAIREEQRQKDAAICRQQARLNRRANLGPEACAAEECATAIERDERGEDQR